MMRRWPSSVFFYYRLNPCDKLVAKRLKIHGLTFHLQILLCTFERNLRIVAMALPNLAR